MKERFKKIILAICMLMFTFTGCSSVEKKEEEMSVSYSNIVCEYYAYSVYGMMQEDFPTHITVYSNNTVEVWTGPFYYQGEQLEVIYSETFDITEEQKQELILAIRENRIIELGDIGNPESCDGGDYYIRLFDAEGNKVHSCGGYNPVDERFDSVRDMIQDLVSREDRNRIHEESYRITGDMMTKIDALEESEGE